MSSSLERDVSLPAPPPIPENVSIRHHASYVMDSSTRTATATSSTRHREGSSYFAMLGNITSDLNTLFTDLCPNHKDHNLHRDDLKVKSGTIHSEDTLGKDSFLSSAGNTSRTLGHRIGSEPSLASSLDTTDPCDCDSVDSGHDGRPRTGPSPLVFDPNHFGQHAKPATSPLTIRVDVSSGMEESRVISMLERLDKTNTIWLLSSLSRAGAVHLLKDRQTGTFIVRKSSQPNSLALSVQNRLSGLSTVDHYLIEGTDSGFRLQGSSHYFHSVPSLIAYYMENKDDIPYLLQLPSPIQDSRSLRELASLALLGQEFWQSPISRRSPTPSLIHKSCSEPIDIQQPFHQTASSNSSNRPMHNTLPSRSPTNFPSHFAQTQSHMDRYFAQHLHHNSHDEQHHSGSDLTRSQDSFTQTLAPKSTAISVVHQTISVTLSHSQSRNKVSDSHPQVPWPESTPPFPVASSSSHSHSRESPFRLGTHPHTPNPSSHQHTPQHLLEGQPMFMSSSSLASPHHSHQPTNNNLSTHLHQLERTAMNMSDSSMHASCQTSCAISAPTAPVPAPEDKYHGRNRSLTHPRSEPKPKSSLYSTTNLGLLEIPENSYFKSSLADRLSDYEDVWKNNCDSDVPYASRKIHYPRSVLDPKLRSNRQKRHNPMFGRDGRRKVFKKTARDTKQSKEREAHSPRDSVTGGRTGLTALERARLIAGSTSDEDSSLLPIAHVKGIQRMENIFNNPIFAKSETENQAASSSIVTASDLSPTTPLSPLVPLDETVVKETCVDNIQFTNSSSSHQIKFITSHSLDFSNKPEEAESLSTHASKQESPSKCVFTTTMSVIVPESASSERKAIAKSSKRVPGPITNLSRIKSSSESSIATVSSPLYLEPADAIKLRDRNGKAVNIQVRRRSAPSIHNSMNKGLSSKISQQTPLETIFSPNEDSKQDTKNSVPLKFVFDNISPEKYNKSKTAVTKIISSKSSQGNSSLQRKHSWRDRLNRLKLGTKVLTQNLTPPAILNNRHQNMMAKQKPVLENLNLQYTNDQEKDHANSPAFSSPGPFPLDFNSSHHAPTRASCFSDTSTIQDMISSTHPELAVKPIVPLSGHPVRGFRGRPGPPLSEYDNLAGYRGSMHSSQGTIYSPPWESISTHRFLHPNSPQHNLPPAMDLNERVQRWQIANSSFQELDQNGSSQSRNNKSSVANLPRSQANGTGRSETPKTPEVLDDDLHITESFDVKTPTQNASLSALQSHPSHLQSNISVNNGDGSYDNLSVSAQPNHASNLLHHQSMDSGTFHQPTSPSHQPSSHSHQPTSPSLLAPSSPPHLSSHHPDVVNCHHAPLSPSTPIPGGEVPPSPVIKEVGPSEEDILFGGDMAIASNELIQKVRPVLLNQESGHIKGSRPGGSKIREYIFRLSGDDHTMFGSTIGNFIECTIESQETNPLHVLRNVRQFMTGIKNYLVKHGEGQLEDIIERERSKLAANEILNIDAIIEQALHVCVLKPLKTHIYKLFVNHYSQSGALQMLSRNIKYARSRSAQELGVKPGMKLPSAADMEVISHHLNHMQRSYSPLQKLNSLLKATSAIYHCVQGKELLPSRGPMSLGADDFLPMLIYVIVHSGLVAAEIEADFMWGLLQPSLLTGEGGYYLTTLSSAVLVLKNFQDTHQLAPGQIEMRLPAISDMQGFLKIAIPNESHGSINWKTLPVRPSMNTRDVCALVAHKFKITNPQDYGLFLLCDSEEKQMLESECPQLIKGDNQAKNKECYFAFKRVDATIAWPTSMKHSPVTVQSEDALDG